MSSTASNIGRRDNADDAVARMEVLQRELSRLRGDLASYANLYVASHRLHGARELAEVLTVLEELVISVVGSEEFGVFAVEEGSDRLVPLRTFGLDPAAAAWVSADDGAAAQCMVDGRLRIGGPGRDLSSHEIGSRLTALVPLRLDQRVVGLIAIFSMLPHKPELAYADITLLELISSHAAISLDYARLRARGPDVTDADAPTCESGARGEP